MLKVVVVATVSAIALAGCTAREQQLLAAGAVGAVAGAVVASEVSQPRPYYVQERPYYVQPRPAYYEERRPIYVQPPRRPHCFSTWENTHRGTVERRVCR
jgi:hypothetical protein